jgi:serine/threonine protein kinase
LELSGEEREALLVKADPEIRRAVERLLLHADTPDSLLDHPAWERAASGEQHAGQFTPGQQIGPYRIDAKIGAGGMGQVYRATDLRLNRIVAVKVTGAEFPARFEREAKAIAALNHPNICQVYDVGPNYLVMEFVDGRPVVTSGQKPISPDQALPLAVQIASAMQAAHAMGIIHRDLKPENILVTASGTVKLLDFGLAKQREEIVSADADREHCHDPRGNDSGHARIHVARAGGRRYGGCALRYLFLRDHPLRDPLRRTCFSGKISGFCAGSHSSSRA